MKNKLQLIFILCTLLLVTEACTRNCYFAEYQLYCTADSSLYVRLSLIDVEDEHIWKLDLGDLENNRFEPWDTFYGSCEWQGASGGCNWWTFAETHICETIYYREDSCIMYFPAGYDCFYPQLKTLLIDDGVKLFPIK